MVECIRRFDIVFGDDQDHFVLSASGHRACSKKDDKGGAANEKATPGIPSLAAGDMAKSGGDGKFTCDTILSKALRDKYFANHKIENIEFPVKHAGKCKVTPPNGLDFEIGAACASFMKNSKDLTVEGLKKQFPDMKEVPGAGDVTLGQEIKGADMMQLIGWNKGSFCQADATLPKTIDAAAFMTEWLASLPSS